jgi:hypothetical protein
MRLHNLLSLPHLFPRHTRGKEPLVGYSQSHVVAFVEYLNIPRIKAMDKATKGFRGKKKRINEPK